MKRRVMFTVITALLLALMVSLSASAQPASYTSGFQLQNQDGTNDANVTISYYNKDGSLNVSPVSDIVPAGGSNTYFPLTDPSAGFDGSVVISSDQPVAAIVNILGDGGSFGAASYDSFSQGATFANIPLVLNDFFGISSFFNVQNTGDADATVTVSYVGSGGSCSEAPVTVAPGAAATFDQTASAASCMTAGFIGAATVTTGGQPVAVAVVQFDSQSLLAYNAFTSDGSTTAVAPLISMNFFGSRTALQIQNTGAAATEVTVNYAPSAGFPGAACTETQTVAAGASGNFGDGNFFDNEPTCNAGSGWVGAAEISTDGENVVAIVNSVTTGTANAAAYSAFDPSAAGTTVNFPLIMRDNFGLFTGYAVANVGAASTDITCTYSNGATTSATGIAVGAALTEVNNATAGLPDGFVGAATCTASEPLVGVVSQLNPGVVIPTGDGLLYYEGFGN